ncbi:hypothetical protein AVEN_154610-1 [Araneus ventricosus]|uniref:Uncharacterized protein n=1 Tax=Araneus ventricosus TaxID=182803 RepID=A0A4Y2SGB3_ARAVE|nr:hypothetical protein AVEN_154610-1 [Araneus ventricosus]
MTGSTSCGKSWVESCDDPEDSTVSSCIDVLETLIPKISGASRASTRNNALDEAICEIEVAPIQHHGRRIEQKKIAESEGLKSGKSTASTATTRGKILEHLGYLIIEYSRCVTDHNVA